MPDRNFTSFMHRIIVETDRDPTQYDHIGPINVGPSLPPSPLANPFAEIGRAHV